MRVSILLKEKNKIKKLNSQIMDFKIKLRFN